MRRLIDQDTIDEMLRDTPHAHSHGTAAGFLGAGLLYYALAYALRAKRCVCLGSGGGYVPWLMRQAQHDLGLAAESETVLIDADLPEAGWGRPEFLHRPNDPFLAEADVRIVVAKTCDAVAEFAGLAIDYLHIDADHSYAGVRGDFDAWSPLVAPGGAITLHDTRYVFGAPNQCGVPQVVRELRADPRWDIVDFGHGTGVAFVTRRTG